MTTFTDKEVRVLAIILNEVAVSTGEDVMGVILKETGHQILDGSGVVTLANKLEAALAGTECYACAGNGTKPDPEPCAYCDGSGKFPGLTTKG